MLTLGKPNITVTTCNLASQGSAKGAIRIMDSTLRQRLPRFVRKTLSFSKSLFMHDACLRLFLHRYNLERAAMLM